MIGVVGGIGSGKSLVSKLLEELGCTVIDSDQAAHEVLRQPEVKAEMVLWWGPEILGADGEINRKAVAGRVFGKPDEIARLNHLVHPKVKERRDLQMAAWRNDPAVQGVVWDTPLLFEVGLDRECDAVIFVNTSFNNRLKRVSISRHWSREELEKREKSQFSLDKKQLLADYSVDNSGDVAATRCQIREIFSLILSRKFPVCRK
ncbi:MAG: dephospho-CoA kinase [Phycisphaerae bacterium]